MVLVFYGKSECGICNQAVQVEDAKAFPAFLKPTHPLHRFSDAIFHRACFEEDPEHNEVDRLFVRFLEIWISRPRDLKTKEEIEAWARTDLKNLNDSFPE